MPERCLFQEDMDRFCRETTDALARLVNVAGDDARIEGFYDDLCDLAKKYWSVDYRNYN